MTFKLALILKSHTFGVYFATLKNNLNEVNIMAFTVDNVVDQITDKMDKAIAHFQSQLDSYSTGKANPSLVQDIMVDAYGTKMRLKETAGVSNT